MKTFVSLPYGVHFRPVFPLFCFYLINRSLDTICLLPKHRVTCMRHSCQVFCELSTIICKTQANNLVDWLPHVAQPPSKRPVWYEALPHTSGKREVIWSKKQRGKQMLKRYARRSGEWMNTCFWDTQEDIYVRNIQCKIWHNHIATNTFLWLVNLVIVLEYIGILIMLFTIVIGRSTILIPYLALP